MYVIFIRFAFVFVGTLLLNSKLSVDIAGVYCMIYVVSKIRVDTYW